MDIWLNVLTLWYKFAFDTKKIGSRTQEIPFYFSIPEYFLYTALYPRKRPIGATVFSKIF